MIPRPVIIVTSAMLLLEREVWTAIDVFAGVFLMTGIAPKVCTQA